MGWLWSISSVVVFYFVLDVGDLVEWYRVWSDCYCYCCCCWQVQMMFVILVWSASAAIEFVQDIFDAELDEVYGSLIDVPQPAEPDAEVFVYITLHCNYIMLYCIVLHYIVWYGMALHDIASHHIASHHITLFIVFYCIVIVLHCVVIILYYLWPPCWLCWPTSHSVLLVMFNPSFFVRLLGWSSPIFTTWPVVTEIFLNGSALWVTSQNFFLSPLHSRSQMTSGACCVVSVYGYVSVISWE